MIGSYACVLLMSQQFALLDESHKFAKLDLSQWHDGRKDCSNYRCPGKGISEQPSQKEAGSSTARK